MRIRVVDILEMLAGGATQEEVLRDFPDVEPEDIRAALDSAEDHDKLPDGTSRAWVEEIQRRRAEIRRGAVELIPWEEVCDQIDQKLDAARTPQE
jgi:hypothetical protein